MTTKKRPKGRAEMQAAPMPPLYLALEDHEIAAIKAISAGTAAPDIQKAAFVCIVQKVCNIGGMSFSPDPYTTAFNEGRRMAGAHLLHVATQPYDKLIKEN